MKKLIITALLLVFCTAGIAFAMDITEARECSACDDIFTKHYTCLTCLPGMSLSDCELCGAEPKTGTIDCSTCAFWQQSVLLGIDTCLEGGNHTARSYDADWVGGVMTWWDWGEAQGELPLGREQTETGWRVLMRQFCHLCGDRTHFLIMETREGELPAEWEAIPDMTGRVEPGQPLEKVRFVPANGGTDYTPKAWTTPTDMPAVVLVPYVPGPLMYQ